MTRIFSTGLLLTVTLACTDARAQNNAVSAFNGDINALASKIYENSTDINTNIQIYGVSANGNIPLVGYLGLNLYVARGTGEYELPLLAGVGYDYLLYAVSPFVRDPKLGLVGVSVGRTELDFDGAPPGSTLKQNDLSLLVAGYLGPVTFSATGTRTQDVDNIFTDQNYVWADAVWYVTPDILLDITVGFKEAKHSYVIALEHQPSSILPNMSYGLGYSWDNGTDEKTIFLALTYRFAEKKSLMKRYREDLFGPR